MREEIKKFIKSIEAYYGAYANDTVRYVVASHLNKYNNDQLKELFDLIIADYSNTYKTPPDVNRFEKALDKKWEQIGLRKVKNYYTDIYGNVFDCNLQKIGHYANDIFYPNVTNKKIRQKVIEYGSDRISPSKYLEIKSKIVKDIIK